MRRSPTWIPIVLLATSCSLHIPLATECRQSQTVSTKFRRLTSHSGAFSISLPKGAEQPRRQCIDSDCGQFCVGDWILRYDRIVPLAFRRSTEPLDSLAAPAVTLTAPNGADLPKYSIERFDGRVLQLISYHWTEYPNPHNAELGSLGAEAQYYSPGPEYLTFYAQSLTREHLAEFFAAVRSVEFLR